MLEKPYAFAGGEEKTIEQVIDRDEVMINHMILPLGAALPQHNANSNVFMTVASGAAPQASAWQPLAVPGP